MRIFIFLALIFFPAPAYAQSSEPLCQFWSMHKPSTDAAYKPGVDVHGKPVVPADINVQMPSLPPSRITFPITVDMARQFNIPVPEGTKMDTDMGMIDVYTDGKILYNGQDMSAQAAALCAEKPAAAEVKQTEPEPLKTKPIEEDKDVIWGEGH